MNDTSEQSQISTVECAPTTEPAVRWFIFAAMMIGFAVWCFSERHEYPAPETWDLEHINEAAKYLLNTWGPVVFAPLGLLAVAMAVAHLRSRLIADDEGIGYAGKQKHTWDRVKKLDVSALKAKGILYLTLDDGSEMKLDSWKLQNFRDLVALIEKKVPGAASGE